MLPAMLLTLCIAPPYFDADPTAAACTPSSQIIPCECSETLVWDAVPELLVDGYYLVRMVGNISGSEVISATGAWTCMGYDEVMGCLGWEATPYFVVEWSEPMPRADEVYTFSVKACLVNNTCSLNWSNTVEFKRGSEWLYCDPREVPACHMMQ